MRRAYLSMTHASLPVLAMTSLGIPVFIWSWGALLWPLAIVPDRGLHSVSTAAMRATAA